jgi:hypothetical protein
VVDAKMEFYRLSLGISLTPKIKLIEPNDEYNRKNEDN